MASSSYDFGGRNVQYSFEGDLTEEVFEALGRLFGNLDFVSKPRGLIRLEISASDGRIHVSERGYDKQGLSLRIYPTEKEIKIEDHPIGVVDLGSYKETLGQAFPDYEIVFLPPEPEF